MKQKLKLFLSLVVLMILGTSGVWAESIDYTIDFTKSWAANLSTSGNSSKCWVTSIADGVPTYETSQPASYLMYFEGYYKNSTYGLYYKPTFKIPVTAGKYKISLGCSDYGGDLTITDGTNTIGAINNKGSKYASDKTAIATTTVTLSSDATITIATTSTNIYFPYFRIESVETPQPSGTSYTFGIGQTDPTATGSAIAKTGTLPTDVTTSITTTSTNGSSSTRSVSNGTETITAVTSACTRNDGKNAFDDTFYFGYDVVIPDGKVLNISQIVGNLFPSNERNAAYKIAVYKGTSKLFENDGRSFTANSISKTDTTIVTSSVTALQNLTGTISVRMPWWQAGTSSYVVLKDLNITATLEDAPEPATFTDFKIDFRVKASDTQAYTVILPTDGVLPSNVTLDAGTYKDTQHGTQDATITVPVTGATKFTIGGCKYTNKATVSINGGAAIDIDTKTPGCENSVSDISSAQYTKYATYTYNSEEAATLTFNLGSYCPYFFAEKTEYVNNVTVSYFDADGTTIIGSEEVAVGTSLAYKYSASDVTVAEGSKFRGWYSSTESSATVVAEGTKVNANLSLYAKVTPIEVATTSSKHEWSLVNFDDNAHDLIKLTNWNRNTGNTHGLYIKNGGKMEVTVGGEAFLSLSLCAYSADAVKVTFSGTGSESKEVAGKVATDGLSVTYHYTGAAGVVTISVSGSYCYMHSLKVMNVADKSVYPTLADGYYKVNAEGTDTERGTHLKDAVDYANMVASENAEMTKVWVPNGTYDLGSSNLNITSDGLGIFGESMANTIIKNTPAQEGLQIAYCLKNTATGTYLQNLTLQSYAPVSHYTGYDAERAHALFDLGTQTICNNVYLKGTQDTYLSQNKSMVAYFKGGKIEGTVDFICGSGKAFFEGVDLYCANSETMSRTSGDIIIAPKPFDNSAAETPIYGYVFNNCTIDGESSQAGTYYLGRGWGETTTTTEVDEWIYAMFAHTTKNIAYSAQATTDMNGSLLTITEQDAAVNYSDYLGTWDPESIIATYDNETKPTQTAEKGAEAWGTAETYTQTLAAGKYSTICLPYTATVQGAKVMNLVNKTEENGKLTSLTFQENTGDMVAGVPYLVLATQNNPVYTKSGDAADVASVTTANGFTGVYASTIVLANDFFLYNEKENGVIVNQYFAPSNGYVKAAPFRAYIKSANVSKIENKENPSQAKVVLGQFNDATSINAVSVQKVSAQNGKFIKNGKLVIVKNGKQYNAAGAQVK